MVQITVTIRPHQAKWIKQRCISPTKLVQKYLELEMAAQNASKKTEEDKPLNRASSELSTPERLEAI